MLNWTCRNKFFARLYVSLRFLQINNDWSLIEIWLNWDDVWSVFQRDYGFTLNCCDQRHLACPCCIIERSRSLKFLYLYLQKGKLLCRIGDILPLKSLVHDFLCRLHLKGQQFLLIIVFSGVSISYSPHFEWRQMFAWVVHFISWRI